MVLAYISIGSNIDPFNNVRRAIAELDQRTEITAISTFYLTEPYGIQSESQPKYLNGMITIETDVSPDQLKWNVLRKIESELGRVRSDDHFTLCEIDLDIIMFDNMVMDSTENGLPVPEIASRPFLAIPMYELAPELVLPGSEIAIKDVAEQFSEHGMDPQVEFTEEMREMIRE